MLTNNTYYLKYRSFVHDFDRDFMIPAYKESVLLQRGSGFFSISSLIMSIEGIKPFIENGGKIQLICNPDLSAKDIAIIEAGNLLTTEQITSTLLHEIQKDAGFTETECKSLDIICNMIAEGRLQIKIAYMPDGIYHEKFGIFSDTYANQVYYIGSANETASAKIKNMESFQVSLSWAGGKELINEESEYFLMLWNNKIKYLTVIDFPDALQQHLFDKYRRSKNLEEAISGGPHCNDSKKELYDFQEKAIERFFENNCTYFYEMATGTGKTFTAIKTIEELKKRTDKPLFVIICVPQVDLQVQWKRALEEEGFDDIALFGGVSKDTDNSITDAIIMNQMGEDDVVCVSVADTFFAKVCARLSNNDDIFLIIDEAHNLTPNQIKLLPTHVKYKLGLSATIQRFSAWETKNILEYFCGKGGKPFYYGIEDAIERGFLSHYNYHPLVVNLDSTEFALFQRKTNAIAVEMNKAESDQDEDLLNRLRTERSLIVKKCANKLAKLQEMVTQNYDFVNSVVYCGQGKVDEEPIIDAVTTTLGTCGLSVHTFTSKTENRPRVLEEFERGYFDVLVAIKCFDEGVDVPKLDKLYIMASDGALRQTVQRRGRVLRTCKETGKTLAHIHDMIVVPPPGIYYENGVKSLVVNEFRRFREYARLADNKDELNKIANEYYNTYEITEEDFKNEQEDG